MDISAKPLQKLLLILIFTSTLILIYLFFEINYISKALQISSSNRAKSFLLVDEFGQSSDDLTRLARIYIETLNPSHKNRYMDILAIREGKKPRPKSYHRATWSFDSKNKSHSYIGNIQKPLVELMEAAGFSQEELKKIKEAKHYSDWLAHIEIKAMNMANGLFMDKKGKYTIKGKANINKARELVFSKKYQKYKQEIMNPIDDLFELMDKRIKLSLMDDEKKMEYLQQFFTAMLLLNAFFIGLFFLSNFLLKSPGKKLSNSKQL